MTWLEPCSDYGFGSLCQDGVVGSLDVLSRPSSETNRANDHSATKVSSISTTNENKGVNIIGSHEVTGKSSTDGTATTAGKNTNLSLDALAKAKKALQKQKELAEKMKKIPLVSSVDFKLTSMRDMLLQPLYLLWCRFLLL